MERLTRSWAIFQHSLAVMRQEPKLLVFPVVSFLSALLLVALAVGGTLLVVEPQALAASFSELQGQDPDGQGQAWWVLPVYFVMYLMAMTVANFCNVAFFREIMRGLAGEPVSVSRGFAYAASRFKAVFLWSLLAATVGMVLKAVEERMGVVGAFVMKLIGVVWAVASVFAIPALVCDDRLDSPIEALKRSAGTIKRTWGEALVGFLGLQILTGACFFLVIALVVGLGLLGGGAGGALQTLSFVGIGLVFVLWFAFAYLVAVGEKIYIAALYRYANGDATPAFADVDLTAAFKTKR